MKRRKLLMIPGPIEFEPSVLRAMGAQTTSHVAADFIEIFGSSLEMMRKVFLAGSGQPFIVSGSGTLAMEIAIANLVEPGDRALVLVTGYFGDRFAEIIERYGAEVDRIKAPLGYSVELEDIERKLKSNRYKLVTVTQVDTSTGIAVDVRHLGNLAHKYGAMVVLDGVCSVAGEELRQEEWNIDLVLTASQKAISVPPGLALLMAGPRAIDAWKFRKTPVLNYYADFTNWLPVMEAYEARKPSYFATPAINLVGALNESLKLILDEGMDARFTRHRLLRDGMQDAIKALGLKQVPVRRDFTATTLSAIYYPDGIDGQKLLAKINSEGIIFAGGLHPEIKNRYFRIGHMGPFSPGEIIYAISAMESALVECGYKFDVGIGLTAAERTFINSHH
ncbi:aminotransferase class V [Microgenomates group bacterium RBG_16_45_19]|nr:MAG: aminotransferase class V [Microgenomates group bacterium RBG_16_45_19]